MDTEPTVLARWTGTVVHTLNSQSHDGPGIARQAGVDPTVLDVDGARIPLSATTELWRLAVEITGNPSFGLDVARRVRSSTFTALSMGVVSSSSFRDALERSIRYTAMVMDPPATAEVIERDRRLCWINSFEYPATAPAPEAMEAILGSIVLAGRYLLGRSFGPAEVFLCRQEPVAIEEFESFFCCPVRFGADEYRLEFDLDEVERRLDTGSEELSAAADRLASQYLEQLEADRPMTSRVRSIIAHLSVGNGPPGVAEIAAALAMSPRTLQRRLRAEGVTVRHLTDQVQADLASRLLVENGMTAELVATKLGFHDASSFRRAFRRWTGTTPQTYVNNERDRS